MLYSISSNIIKNKIYIYNKKIKKKKKNNSVTKKKIKVYLPNIICLNEIIETFENCYIEYAKKKL